MPTRTALSWLPGITTNGIPSSRITRWVKSANNATAPSGGTARSKHITRQEHRVDRFVAAKPHHLAEDVSLVVQKRHLAEPTPQVPVSRMKQPHQPSAYGSPLTPCSIVFVRSAGRRPRLGWEALTNSLRQGEGLATAPHGNSAGIAGPFRYSPGMLRNLLSTSLCLALCLACGDDDDDHDHDHDASADAAPIGDASGTDAPTQASQCATFCSTASTRCPTQFQDFWQNDIPTCESDCNAQSDAVVTCWVKHLGFAGQPSPTAPATHCPHAAGDPVPAAGTPPDCLRPE